MKLVTYDEGCVGNWSQVVLPGIVCFQKIVAHYSSMGYSAGDIVSTGTVPGVAGFNEDAASQYLSPGDVVEAEIERVGVLRGPVVPWDDARSGRTAPASLTANV